MSVARWSWGFLASKAKELIARYELSKWHSVRVLNFGRSFLSEKRFISSNGGRIACASS